ncbi:hypothetical protein MUO93_12250 [Candidatus Bathyarchaeota archaeon]|nr:hypothetical protein [Candidatus Bathyarchaeota archaeon]
MNRVNTPLRHDLLYLRLIVAEAVSLQTAANTDERTTLGTLQDYLTWLTTDAIQDKQLARKLVSTYARLQEELNAETRKRLAHDTDLSAPAFHEGFLHALEQTLSFKHGADLLLDEKISRGEFHESWEQAMRRLIPVEEG